jgi:hypothetical protein
MNALLSVPSSASGTEEPSLNPARVYYFKGKIAILLCLIDFKKIMFAYFIDQK